MAEGDVPISKGNAKWRWGKGESRFQCNRNARKMLRMRDAEARINWTNAGFSR
jgi:hypothetical protein